MGRYIEGDGDFPQAEAMFERLIGHQFAVSTHIENHRFGKHTGRQIQLKHFPVEILSCDGFLIFDELKFKDWMAIPIENICQIGQVLDIPPSIFQVPFEKIRVIYLAGETEIPEEIRKAVQEIADLLADEDMNEWNLPLSQSTLDVIGKYKK